MLRINVPHAPWSEQSVTLNGTEYRFVFKFNERDQRWRLDIYQRERAIILGLKIMENQLLLVNYVLDDFSHGDIGCFRMEKDFSNVGYDNLGFNKAYELIYITHDKLSEWYNDPTI